MYYFTGKPCKRGHIAMRLKSSRACVICRREHSTAYKKANPEQTRKHARDSYWRNPVAFRERTRQRYASDPSYALEYNRRPESRVKNRAYKNSRPEQRNKDQGKRRAAKLQRTPVWADAAQIAVYYKIAANLTRAMGRPYEVDHFIPLQGKLVSGLHVQNNLQVLTMEENCRKLNSFEGALRESY